MRPDFGGRKSLCATLVDKIWPIGNHAAGEKPQQAARNLVLGLPSWRKRNNTLTLTRPPPTSTCFDRNREAAGKPDDELTIIRPPVRGHINSRSSGLPRCSTSRG